jgi:hypothetical protein
VSLPESHIRPAGRIPYTPKIGGRKDGYKQFGARARVSFADRGARRGGGNGAADRGWHDDQQEAQAPTDDDQEQAQTLTAHDELIAAASVMNDMLDAEQMQQMQQERLQADEALKNKMQGLFDFSKALFITLPARTIPLFHTISARPPKQPRMVRTFLKVHTRPRLAYALRCRGY